jgi:hypothetical protein
MAGTLETYRFFVTCKLVFLLSVPSFPIALAEAHEDGTSCWFGRVPEGMDPCELMEQAQGLLADIPPPVEGHVRELAAGLDIERSLRVQEKLLREHLAWLDEDLTERQLDLMIFLAVALSLDRAQARISELRGLLEQGTQSDHERSIQDIELYRSQALSLLDRLSPGLEDLSERELRMRF